MIDGEPGQAIFDNVIALRMDALIDGDKVTTMLVAACITDALRKGISPRQAAQDLWEGLPDEFAWAAPGGARDRISDAIEKFEEGDIAA